MQSLGAPALKVAGMELWVHERQFPELNDHHDGNWLRVSAHCGASGASVWVQGSILQVTDIERFGQQCSDLLSARAPAAVLHSYEPELRVTLESVDALGHLSVRVEITPDHLAQDHEMTFEIDQSYLPGIIEQCSAIVREYPVRGM